MSAELTRCVVDQVCVAWAAQGKGGWGPGRSSSGAKAAAGRAWRVWESVGMSGAEGSRR